MFVENWIHNYWIDNMFSGKKVQSHPTRYVQ